MVRIAIVGSKEKYWTPTQREQVIARIKEIFEDAAWVNVWRGHEWNRVKLVSGGCHKGGVDIWAEIVADILGIQKEIHLPKNHRWKPNGYRKRNIQIARACDIIYCFDPEGREWSGGLWTMCQVEKMGKDAHLIIVREEV